jgi:hypothetical protein
MKPFLRVLVPPHPFQGPPMHEKEPSIEEAKNIFQAACDRALAHLDKGKQTDLALTVTNVSEVDNKIALEKTPIDPLVEQWISLDHMASEWAKLGKDCLISLGIVKQGANGIMVRTWTKGGDAIDPVDGPFPPRSLMGDDAGWAFLHGVLPRDPIPLLPGTALEGKISKYPYSGNKHFAIVEGPEKLCRAARAACCLEILEEFGEAVVCLAYPTSGDMSGLRGVEWPDGTKILVGCEGMEDRVRELELGQTIVLW